MALVYEIAADQQLARVTGEGIADFESLIGLLAELVADPAYSSDFDIITDFSKLDYTPSFREIKRFASQFEAVRSTLPPRVAIVVKDRLQLRLGRFAAMVAGMLKFDLSVFDNSEAAENWVARRRAARRDDLQAKILEIFAQPQLAALATLTPDGAPWARYVLTTASAELWFRFATYRGSRKAAQIRNNPEVHLVAGAATMVTAERWVQVSGRAELSAKEEDRHLCWHESLAPFFDGMGDQNLVAVVVKPYRIEYMEMGFSQPELWQP